MRATLLILISVLCLTFTACSQDDIEVIELEAPEGVRVTPRTGIPLGQLATAWAEILPQLPKEHTLLDLTVISETEIEVTTCEKDSHSRGVGGHYVFQKLRGKWVATSTGSWVS